MNALDRSKNPVPTHRAWAEKHGTPWEVSFPKRGALPGRRRFFATEQEANDAITDWAKGDTTTSLPKRLVDEVHYLITLLPPGVSFTDTVRFYNQHHAGLTVATVKTISDAYLLDIDRSASSKYNEEQKRVVAELVKLFGEETLFSSLSKARLISTIKEPSSYWGRYARKRAIGCLITKARELDALKVNPLDGWKFEDAPKSTPHTLKNEIVQAFLEAALVHQPHLVPAYAFQFFHGIRTEELCRKDEEDGSKRALVWGDVKFGTSTIVTVEVAKMDDERTIGFWPEALTHWLNAAQKALGLAAWNQQARVCPIENLHDAKRKILAIVRDERAKAKLSEVDFKQNDFRRTAASNMKVLYPAQVQDWLGHSDGRMLKRHYNNSKVTAEEATVYFRSRPAALAPNVVSLSA